MYTIFNNMHSIMLMHDLMRYKGKIIFKNKQSYANCSVIWVVCFQIYGSQNFLMSCKQGRERNQGPQGHTISPPPTRSSILNLSLTCRLFENSR